MWRQPFRSTFFQQSTSRILQCNIVFKCFSNTNVRCATFLPSLPLKQKTLNSETAGARKQNVIKKVESPTEGRKLLQIYPPPSMINCQTILLPGSEKIRASAVVEHPEKFIDSLSNDTQTVCDAVMTGLLKSSTGKCLGFRMPPKVGEYNWITYAEAVEKKNFIGSGLVNLGLEPSQKTMVGICTKTRPEFVLSMLACSHFSMVLVPLYHCFGMEAISQIIQQVEMEAVICETSELANDIIKNGVKYPMLKHIILMEEDEGELAKSCDKYNILSFRELEENGQRYPRSPVKPKPDDTFCICYTSGTTGEPKGVIVSHRNVLSCIGALDTVLGDAISKDSSLMCYLPCAHIYEIINEIFCLYHGGRLGFYSGTTEDLLSDIKKFQPNVVPLVPKLMNIIYSAVRKQIGPHPIKRSLFRFAIQQKKKQLKRGVVSKTSIWDAIFFSKIQEQLGGRVQMIFSSSAPVCKEIMQFFRSSMGCLVFEVYGLSEVGACTMTLMSEDDSGFVGAPLPCNHVKLVSIPELDYYAEDNVGEICIRGANVFKGYFKNPTATKEVLDEDGWYHTGDIGMWLPNGTLSIIDRKKHIFKMSQGEYIIPEKSEGVYMQSPIVSQIFVDGDPNQDFTVGIMVPDRNLFMQWAKRKGFPETDFENLCNDKRVKQEVLMHLSKLGKRRGLKSLHQVGNIYLCSEPFSQDNGLLTPTLKLKRSNARKAFENIFNDLYEEGNLRKMYDV